MNKSLVLSGQVVASMVGAGLLCALLPRPKRVRRGQVAIITGGSSGLGLALAHEFGKAGLQLVLAARDEAQLDAAKSELLSAGSVARAEDLLLVPCDVSDKEQAAGLVTAAITVFGSLDLVINNAGIILVGPAEDMPIEAYERAMAVDFFGALYVTYAALPYFLKRGDGAVVNISSVGGKIAVPHLLPYVAAKFALTGFSEGLHAELRHKGIRVTTVCPGLMQTGGESHAQFYGQIEGEKAWFQGAARTPLLSVSVGYAAKKILSAVSAGRAEITISPQAWLAARFAGMAPETTQLLNAMVNECVLPNAVGEQIFELW